MLEFFLLVILVEIVFYLFSIYIRKRNQWFIISKDKEPIFEKQVLEKVLSKSYDPLLGWDRKPNSSGIEVNENKTVEWSINNNGARNNLEYNYKKSFISIFGDSFSFSREVNDDETWGYKLSLLTKSNVENFGVGNYGFDQALIKLTNKLETENFRPRLVIIGVVPDTISRILSVWKHYYEYGNIFGFKPRYVLKDNKLELINNYINSKEKFFSINKYIDLIEEHDFFYKHKFLKELIEFPYTINFLKNFKRNVILSYETILNGYINKPTAYIMKNNLEYRVKLYEDNQNINLLIEELKLFKMLSSKYDFTPYFFIMPQKDDVNYMNQHKHYYKELVDNVPSDIKCIDLYNDLKGLSATKLNELYSEDSEYGGHFSSIGNNFVAEIVYNKINIRSQDEKSL